MAKKATAKKVVTKKITSRKIKPKNKIDFSLDSEAIQVKSSIIELDMTDPRIFEMIERLLKGGGYLSVGEVVRDILRRALLGDPPPRSIKDIPPKKSSKK